ncbi:zinc-binding dehydrogenase [Paenibacillus sp. KACC 21273]|uniref:zinc-binding dehydrogenase n=1 Tax=Paenibacillus sp. KACC 21273 TaxID=3025665 RepID=UPI0030825AF7
MMNMMRAMQVGNKGEPLTLVELPIPRPNKNQVLVRIEACGVCNGDSTTIKGAAPHYPRIPGHEVIGVIEEIGSESDRWKPGQRVGTGWHAENNHVNGLTVDGGYAEYMIIAEDHLVQIPDELSSEEAAPLMCAGETTFSALRNSIARSGDLVAVVGIGGLGHLALQYAKKSGYETVAISRGNHKKELAQKLGAHHYIDSEQSDPAKELKKLGGAKVILATAPNPALISSMIHGLTKKGELIVVAGSGKPLDLSTMDFLRGSYTIKGSFTGYAEEIKNAIRFSVLTEVRPQIEVFPLERAQEAYHKMITAQTQFRAVLKMPSQ